MACRRFNVFLLTVANPTHNQRHFFVRGEIERN
jgi:hypothetical protein